MIPLDSDVAAAFPDARSVNEALRALLRIAAGIRPSGPRPGRFERRPFERNFPPREPRSTGRDRPVDRRDERGDSDD